MHIGLSLGINNPILRTSSGGVTPPLDDYTGAQTAWSVARKLRTAYSGSLIRVRRDSDNAEQDIGFDGNGNLDESALTTFVGANSGYVTTAYDQSGNANDWTQATSSEQPRIVDAGTVEKVNGKPAYRCIYSIPTNQGLVSTITGGATSTIFSVTKFISGITVSFCDDTHTDYFGVSANSSSSNSYAFAGSPLNYVNSSLIGNTRDDLYTAAINNQILLSVTDLNLTSWSAMKSGYINTTNFKSNDYYQEVILYNSDKSSDRTAIETNINDYYGIY